MNSRYGLIGVLAFLVLLLAGQTMTDMPAAPPNNPQPRSWEPIQAAINKGLPKTAISEIEKQLPGAIEKGDHDLVVRLLATRATLDGQLEGRDEVHRIVRLQADLETAPPATRPVIRGLLANWFWGYYSQNQWRFRDRTEVDPGIVDAEKPVVIKSFEDISTWTRQRIVAQSAALFESALNDDGSKQTLQETAIEDYSDLLVGGNAPDEYRPTLYDFIVADAIDFYSDANETYSGPADRFELEVGTPIFADVDQFISWQVPETDLRSPLYRATTLYQEWLAFHRNDANSAALIDTDLHRLEFADEHAVGDGMKEALRSFVMRNAKSEISTRAQFKLAQLAREDDDPALAREIALAAIKAHPNSRGAAACRALVKQIEAPSIDLSTEQVWNPQLDDSSRPVITVRYRNVTKVHFRLVQLDFESLRKSGRRPGNLTEVGRQMLTKRTPVIAWTEALPETDDYRERTEDVASRVDVPRGAYYLLASTSEDFPLGDSYTAITDVWVSGLSMVVESRHEEGVLTGYVLDSLTGEPLAGVSVDVWARKSQPRRGISEPQLRETLKTTKEGRFEFSGESLHNINFLASRGKDQLWSDEYHIYHQRSRPSHDVTRSHFFTDRALYRPGQIVRYKLICTRSNQAKGEYAVAPDEKISVELLDANGKVVETAELRCNELGSCHGSFNLPSGGLTGQMMLRTRGAYQGSQRIRVEEYKRPKFEVKVESPTAPVRLGESVTVTGTATAYTGAAIDGATVRYRVVRETELPPWWWYRCWWMPPSPMPPQTIAEGETKTDDAGKFSVSFEAIPDRTVDRESEPKFRYKIEADVIDTTGETREGSTTVLVGYTMMEATLSTATPQWLTDEEPIEIKVATRTLQGGPVSSKVTVKIHSLQSPDKIGRRQIGYPVPYWAPRGDADDAPKDVVRPEEPNSWPIDGTIKTVELTTDESGNASLEVELEAGHFRAVLSAVDSAGQSVSAILPLRVIDPDAEECELKIADLFAVQSASVEPGDTFRAVWGSGYESARALVEISHRGKALQRYWTPKNRTQSQITLDIDESLRGGFTVRVWMVRENRFYLNEQRIDVPWSNKELTVRWERFLSKLKPGQQETWTAIIEDKSGSTDAAMKRAAEMVATLYDASLDAFAPHDFLSGFGLFYTDYSRVSVNDQNRWEGLQQISVHRSIPIPSATPTYRDYPPELQGAAVMRFGMMRSRAFGGRMMQKGMIAEEGMPMPSAAPMMMADSALAMDEAESADMADSAPPPTDKPGSDIDLSDVSPRKNLNETAFFFPELTADENGVVTMSFTMPEALTRWKLLGFAHTADLAGGLITDTAVTSKELMVQPNPPRILREGDEIELTVKVSNQSATIQTGTVAFEFTDARTGESVDAKIGNAQVRQSFEVAAGRSQTFSWPIQVPDGLGFLVYKAVASTGRLSDGEEGYLPVLSRKILVHESIALPIDGKETKTFTLDKLASLDPNSIRNESLTVQMTSNPAWYAVMALPYLMDYPHECSEQTFNRLYANLLARHIATSDPKIERVFEIWRNQPRAIKGQPAGRDALESPLQQNEDLASIALTETPWVIEAESESEARRNVGILFDQNRVNEQVARLTKRLEDLQLDDGSWPWFPGGRSNPFITLYLATGYGRLRHLGVDVDVSSAIESLSHLDAYSKKVYTEIKSKDRNTNHLSTTIAMYLYGRSFFLRDADIDAASRPALEYWLDQAAKHWLTQPRMSQAHLAVALKRFGRGDDAMAIVASLKERSVTDETGMHWNDEVHGWFWYQADIETQAMMIEMFDEVASDQESVESCKGWLLRQKETRSWETTKATADAVYALLLRGAGLLADQTLVDVKVGETEVVQENVEAGTGFFQQRFEGSEITPEMGAITVTKTTPGIAWGGVHWKYFQNIDEVTPHEGTPLEIQKQLFVVRSTPSGEVLRPVVGGLVAGDGTDNVDVDGTPIKVGDELVSRLIVRSSRAMEFIHLKDSRGSGTEPTNVLSGYRWRDGLGYYQSTRDAAEHFFIDYLPKGTYVLESRSRVQLRGRYQSGLATIESMYAPQYNSHSESHEMKVGD
ncbi:alpha-2-macroglobulin family protein [Aporhodopirellula aestuarii]|uniref:MG2 domain-containing protein n=2 Tax=Aporhodopirellula aestuarii TaxID=2950107 RepID=A0ABT0UAZ6_9BACT|nr:alpha-2-macroglobulin family protein [Aporhodopirellula aestuarii]MCM2374056.1 MG2 domain-containing protein [Aporhodopirellula aestuarii]